MCKNNNCKCSNIKKKDISIRESVELAFDEDILEGIDLTVNEILEDIKDNDIMMDGIRHAIYNSIQRKLKENNKKNEIVDFHVRNSKNSLILLLDN